MEISFVENLIKKEAVTNYYDLQQELGRGRFAVVKRCVSLETGEVFAAKIIKKSRGRSKRDQLLLEIHILHTSEHPKLVRLFDVFETRAEMILILEFAHGGDLHRHCCEAETARTEKEIAYLIRQITEAIRYLHDRSVVHLDLKPDNILLKKEGQLFPEIKLIDFGLSRKVDDKSMQCDIVGTPEYVAPEVIAYDPIVLNTDMWSIGVVTYVLLTGISPFAGDDPMETYANIGMVEYDFDCEEWDDISEDATDFIEKLLERRPRDRMTAREALEHPWLKQLENGLTSADVAAALAAQQDRPPESIEACPLEFEEDIVSDNDSMISSTVDDSLNEVGRTKESQSDSPKNIVGSNDLSVVGEVSEPPVSKELQLENLTLVKSINVYGTATTSAEARMEVKVHEEKNEVTASGKSSVPHFAQDLNILSPKMMLLEDKSDLPRKGPVKFLNNDEEVGKTIVDGIVKTNQMCHSDERQRRGKIKTNEAKKCDEKFNIKGIEREDFESSSVNSIQSNMTPDGIASKMVDKIANFQENVENQTPKRDSPARMRTKFSSISSSFDKNITCVSSPSVLPKITSKKCPKQNDEVSSVKSHTTSGLDISETTTPKIILQTIPPKSFENQSIKIKQSLNNGPPTKDVCEPTKVIMDIHKSEVNSSDSASLNTNIHIDDSYMALDSDSKATMVLNDPNSRDSIRLPEKTEPSDSASVVTTNTKMSRTSIKLGGPRFNIGPLVSMAKDVSVKEQTEEDEDKQCKKSNFPIKLMMGSPVKMNLDLSRSQKNNVDQATVESDKKLRKHSNAQRRDPASPRKNYRRLYVTKVRNTKIYDIGSNVDPATAEIKARVENDVMKIEFVLKAADFLF